MHKRLKEDGRTNFRGLQLPVQSKLNYQKFAEYLKDYWDWQLPLFIKFGFPFDIKDEDNIKINYKSAILNPKDTEAYLQEEIKHNAILGLFSTPPFPVHTSPFLTQDKANSETKRVIVDLSWPLGQSVNNQVASNNYVDRDFILTLPTIDNVTKSVRKFGQNCFIAKVDISRAFKHIPISFVLEFLFYWKNLVFGFKQGSQIFQRCSDSIRYFMSKEKHYILNYIDDYLIFGKKINVAELLIGFINFWKN